MCLTQFIIMPFSPFPRPSIPYFLPQVYFILVTSTAPHPLTPWPPHDLLATHKYDIYGEDAHPSDIEWTDIIFSKPLTPSWTLLESDNALNSPMVAGGRGRRKSHRHTFYSLSLGSI